MMLTLGCSDAIFTGLFVVEENGFGVVDGPASLRSDSEQAWRWIDGEGAVRDVEHGGRSLPPEHHQGRREIGIEPQRGTVRSAIDRDRFVIPRVQNHARYAEHTIGGMSEFHSLVVRVLGPAVAKDTNPR